MAAKPRSAEGVKAKPRGRRRLARTPAKPGQEPLSGYSIENAAYYIAGQAAVARGIGATVNSARIIPRSDYEGEIAIGPGRCRDLEDRHLIYLAGPFAQRRFSPRSNWRSGNDDFDIIKKSSLGNSTAAVSRNGILRFWKSPPNVSSIIFGPISRRSQRRCSTTRH